MPVGLQSTRVVQLILQFFNIVAWSSCFFLYNLDFLTYPPKPNPNPDPNPDPLPDPNSDPNRHPAPSPDPNPEPWLSS